MGESELKIALLREGEERVREFWQAAEETVAQSRREFEAERAQMRLEADRQLQAKISRLRTRLLAEAQARAMACRLKAEAELEERLKRLASQLLTELAAEHREALWQALCAELPPAEWCKITVTQSDQGLAARTFPAAEIELDEKLAGGLIATSGGGRVQIDNSLGCRLLRAWPDLLPQLMSELRELVDKDETP